MNRKKCQYKLKIDSTSVGVTIPWAFCGCDVDQPNDTMMQNGWRAGVKRLGDTEECFYLDSYWRKDVLSGLTYLFNDRVHNLPKGRYMMTIYNDDVACAWLELEIVKTPLLDMSAPTLLVEGHKINV